MRSKIRHPCPNSWSRAASRRHRLGQAGDALLAGEQRGADRSIVHLAFARCRHAVDDQCDQDDDGTERHQAEPVLRPEARPAHSSCGCCLGCRALAQERRVHEGLALRAVDQPGTVMWALQSGHWIDAILVILRDIQPDAVVPALASAVVPAASYDCSTVENCVL